MATTHELPSIPPMPEQAPVTPYSSDDFIPLDDVARRAEVTRAALEPADELKKRVGELEVKPEPGEFFTEQQHEDALTKHIVAAEPVILAAARSAFRPLGRDVESVKPENGGLPVLHVTYASRTMVTHQQDASAKGEQFVPPKPQIISGVGSPRDLARNVQIASRLAHANPKRELLDLAKIDEEAQAAEEATAASVTLEGEVLNEVRAPETSQSEINPVGRLLGSLVALKLSASFGIDGTMVIRNSDGHEVMTLADTDAARTALGGLLRVISGARPTEVADQALPQE